MIPRTSDSASSSRYCSFGRTTRTGQCAVRSALCTVLAIISEPGLACLAKLFEIEHRAMLLNRHRNHVDASVQAASRSGSIKDRSHPVSSISKTTADIGPWVVVWENNDPIDESGHRLGVANH